MKIAIVFDVPDGQTDAYADIADQMIKHHAFAEQQHLEHWSFHREMRPAAVIVGADAFADMVRTAIVVNLHPVPPSCGCCGATETEGIPDAVTEIVTKTFGAPTD
jgi:hypothetical protein